MAVFCILCRELRGGFPGLVFGFRGIPICASKEASRIIFGISRFWGLLFNQNEICLGISDKSAVFFFLQRYFLSGLDAAFFVRFLSWLPWWFCGFVSCIRGNSNFSFHREWVVSFSTFLDFSGSSRTDRNWSSNFGRECGFVFSLAGFFSVLRVGILCRELRGGFLGFRFWFSGDSNL